MPAYVILNKWTQQGISNIKASPNRLEQAKAAAGKMGIRLIGFWVTMGEYDMVSIWEAPDDQTIGTLALATASLGNVTTQTLKAFSEEEFAQIVSKLP